MLLRVTDAGSEFWPGTLFDPTRASGALIYGLLFFILALIAARLIRVFERHLVRTFPEIGPIHFASQLAQAGIYVSALILWSHLVPPLRALGTALLTGFSIATVVMGLAAQNTLGNLIAGVALLLYRPFEVGDTVHVNTPRGVQQGTVVRLTLGHTIIVNEAGQSIIVPNSVMATSVIINESTDVESFDRPK